MISRSIAAELYRRVSRIRIVEETIAGRYSEWKMRCPTHLCTGQEAVSAGVGLALQDDDFAVGTHRSHGTYLGKGGGLNRMLAEIYGKGEGCSKGKGGSMHLIDKSVGFMGSTAIVGGTIPLGVGLGLSIKLRGSDRVSCVFFGDGATEEGVFYESVNFAVLKKLPVLFICENNLYSVYSPLHVRQPEGRKIHKMAESLGIAGSFGDGNDAMEVYDQARAAVDSIRKGHGPRLLEFATYRWREHCGPNFDNDIGYRTEDEYQAWREKDPLILLQNRLRADAILTSEDMQKIENENKKEVEDAFTFAEEADFPPPGEAELHLFKSRL